MNLSLPKPFIFKKIFTKQFESLLFARHHSVLIIEHGTSRMGVQVIRKLTSYEISLMINRTHL